MRVALEELLEQPPSRGHVEMLGLAGPEDILEQGEALDAHFQAVARQELLESTHEHG